MDFIHVDQEKCIKCAICTDLCPTKVLKMTDNGPHANDSQLCIACGHCAAVCPNQAIDNDKTPLRNQIELERFPVIGAETDYQFLRSRRSVRRFKPERVPRSQILKLIDITRFAQTASNKQGISYVVIDDRITLKKVTELTIQWMEENQSHWWSFPLHVRAYKETGIDRILHSAPVLIAATAPRNFKNGRENSILSLTYLELFANTLGLGSTWAGLLEMCAFSQDNPLLKLLKIPEDKVITGAVMVGFPQYTFKRLVDRNPLDVTWLNGEE